METCRVRLTDRQGEFFGYCDVVGVFGAHLLPEVIALKGWPGRVYLRDRKNDLETDVLVVHCYREVSFAYAENFQLRSGA